MSEREKNKKKETKYKNWVEMKIIWNRKK